MLFSHLLPSSFLPLSLSLCVNMCVQIPRLRTHRRRKHLVSMKAVSGNFTLSHACSHVGLPRANSLPVSAAACARDAPSGDTGVKQAAQVGVGGLFQWEEEEEGDGFVVLNVAEKSDSNVEHRLKRFITILRGFSRVQNQKRSTVTDLGFLKQRLTVAGSYSHLVATLTNKSGVREGRGVEVHLL